MFVSFCRAHSVAEAESNNSRLVVLRMNKNDLDDAHKDKQNKIFSSDFKVGYANFMAQILSVNG